MRTDDFTASMESFIGKYVTSTTANADEDFKPKQPYDLLFGLDNGLDNEEI